LGTLHPSIGREREKGMPPVSIWQWNPCGFASLPREKCAANAKH
jgi:hypothetical protein